MKRLFLFYFFINSVFAAWAQSESSLSEAQKEVFSKIDFVVENNLFTDVIDENSLTSLPIGIIREFGATRYIIAIDSAVFKPNGAYFNAYFAIEFPGSGKRIAFAAKNIKFNPQGVIGGEQSKLVLVSEHLFRISPKVSLHLIPDGNNYIEWNCEGFQSINLKGNFEFSNEWLLPASGQNEKVTAGFEIHTSDIHNFITSVSISPFTLSGLNGWEFKTNNAVVDMSELANHPSTLFPADYSFPFVNSPEFWTGFYLQNLSVKLPPELSKNNQRTEINVQNLMIDNTGFTGKIQLNNIFTVEEGNMSGWGFSLDELGVSFLSNQLVGGSMKGKIKIPAMDENGITYGALLSYHPSQQRTDYHFTLSPADDLSFQAFAARVDVYSSSFLEIGMVNERFKPKAVLNGRIMFAHDNANTPKLDFQNLTFETQAPFLTNGVLSYVGNSNEQSKVAKFNVSVNNFRIVQSPSNPKFGMDVALNFMDAGSNSFSVGSTVHFGANVSSTSGHQSWSLDKVSIGRINMKIQTTPFYLRGYLDFKDNDPLYGDGFAGGIVFCLNNIMNDSMTVNAQFGNTTFKYFYLDGYLPVTIPLGTIQLTRLGGGLYYHMRPVNTNPSQFYTNLNVAPDPNAHRNKYIPDASISVGFKAGVNFQSNKSEKAMNGDALLEVAFQTSGGLDFIKLQGAVFMMATVQERMTKPAPAYGQVIIQYDHIHRIFDATLGAFVHAQGISGQAIAKIHIEPEIWFVCVGRPSQPASISIANLATASAYVLVGNQLEPMPPPPAIVSTLVNSNGLNNLRNNSSLEEASGFAAGISFGSSFSSEKEDSHFQIYSSFAYGVGLDMMLANYGPNAHCQNSTQSAGLNGWIAQGQLYAYLQGVVGVKGRIAKKDFDIAIINGTVAALLAGKLPNPSYVYGALACQYSILGILNGSFTLDFQIGNDCTIQS